MSNIVPKTQGQALVLSLIEKFGVDEVARLLALNQSQLTAIAISSRLAHASASDIPRLTN